MANKKTAPDILSEAADTFRERGKVYGNGPEVFGVVMFALFPNATVISDPSSYERYGLLTQIVSKLVRYANNFDRGGHDDSLLDLSVYAAMLLEADIKTRAMHSNLANQTPPDGDD